MVAHPIAVRELAILAGGCETFALGRAHRRGKSAKLAEEALWRHLFALFMLCGV